MIARPEFSLFPNGTSHMMWRERNCNRCVKGPKPDLVGHNRACPIEDAIAIASALDGSLLHCGETPINKANEIARRLNWNGQSYLEHDCPEFVP
jgi:hypothetical protein